MKFLTETDKNITYPKCRLILLLIFTLLFALQTPSLFAQGIRLRFVQIGRSVIETRLHKTIDKKAKSNLEREITLKELFEEAGCKADRLQEQTVKGSRVPNVICVLPGSDESTIVVGAHFDKVSEGEGVIDNWSGASLLPSLYESIAKQPRYFTFLFIGFSDEEKGLVGSKYYTKHLAREQIAKTVAMMNMDSLGLSGTKVWTSRADKKLLELAIRLANGLQLPLQGMNVENVGDSDSHSFVDKKIPSIDFHSITQETLPLLHTDRDKASAINIDALYDTYHLLSAYLSFLDSTLKPGAEKPLVTAPALP